MGNCTTKEWILGAPEEWKKVEMREVILEASHGGIANGDTDRIVEWYQWINQKKNFANAQNHCVQLGGNLFSKVDGTSEQLAFFHQKMGYARHWLGIYTEDHLVWKNVQEETVPQNLIWAGPNPDNYNGNQYYVSNNKKLDDVNAGAPLKFFCDMLDS